MDVPASHEAIIRYMDTYFGPVPETPLLDLIPGELPVQLYAIPPTPIRSDLMLFTVGMSDRPLWTPEGFEDFRYAELFIRLPGDWPLTPEALADPASGWPVEWLRRVARYPQEEENWLGGPYTIISNDYPPRPLAPDVGFTCMLVLSELIRGAGPETASGEGIRFYSLFPLYTEERDLEREWGVEELLIRFQDRGIEAAVDLHRANVALS